jgi:hypothetical protein
MYRPHAATLPSIAPVEPKRSGKAVDRNSVSRAFSAILAEAESVQDVVSVSRRARAAREGLIAPLAEAWQGLQRGVAGAAWLPWLGRTAQGRRR